MFYNSNISSYINEKYEFDQSVQVIKSSLSKNKHKNKTLYHTNYNNYEKRNNNSYINNISNKNAHHHKHNKVIN